ncbi:MAG: ATP-binding protein [Spirochaetales bacterium]
MAISILQNISLIVSIAVIYHFVSRQLHGRPLIVSALNGVLFGSAAMLAMLNPFHFATGIIYDGRTIIIAVAGLFGGPLVVGVAVAIAVAFRVFHVGGTGYLAGILSILFAAAIGLAFFYWRKRSGKPLNNWRLLGIGYLVHFFMLVAQFALPDQRWKTILPAIVVPVLLLYPLAFFFICRLFIDNEERANNLAMLEESEARYRLLFKAHNSIMLLIDPDSGRIIDANPSAEAFYGWTRSQLLSMNISEINIQPAEQIKERIKLIQNQDKSIFILKHRRAFGDVRDVEVFSSPVEYAGEKVLYSIVHDATARIQAEKKVRELNQTLEQRVAKRTQELQDANKELEAFAYSVSHDLRAPLRAIEGFSSLLSEEAGKTLSESSQHYLGRIRYNAKKMSQLIDDLLRLSRISRQNLEYSKVDLSLLAREIAGEMAARYPERKISISIQENMIAMADKALVEVLLLNLIGNACKFTASTANAEIRFERMDMDGQGIYAVTDNGIGFDMEYADKLFSPFQRLHNEKEYEGSGIGLSIARRIVARHGGRIWAESAPKQGAKFYFTLGGG